MIRKRAGQRSFSDAILVGAHIPDPKTLLDPVLRKLDELLGSDELVDEVLEAVRHRRPQSARRGRPGTPAEVVLRLLAFKHLRQLRSSNGRSSAAILARLDSSTVSLSPIA